MSLHTWFPKYALSQGFVDLGRLLAFSKLHLGVFIDRKVLGDIHADSKINVFQLTDELSWRHPAVSASLGEALPAAR